MAVAALNELSACDIVRSVREGALTAEAVTRACLDRIAARENAVRAWAFIDPELALRQARDRDRAKLKGPLHGLPIGVKDVFDTHDMPTDMGSSIYRGNRPIADASCVALVRAAGAVILGKTITCEFAGLTPNVTRNPHDPARTPGGSSSGSAAAVADHMVHVAFGTQTGGSVLRPASFCGVVGYKPTYNIISRGGMKFAAESRDTIGLFARTVEDVDLVASVLTGRARAKSHNTLPKIALCRTHLWDRATPESKHAVEDAARRLNVTLEAAAPPQFDALAEARTVINPFERARALAHEWNTNAALISPGLTAQIEKGLAVPHARYIASLQRMKECRELIPALFGDADVLLAPCVTGEAPSGLDTTGEPMFQEFWTALHVPTITLPTHRGPNGLPIGIQLVARHYEDETLLAFAKVIFERLGASAHATAA
jgi:Asp-tRNA(Asn)/Glu-tRNA(Gln) amidotransferase A subunit family amidase